MAARAAPAVLTRVEQQRHFGVDCGDAIQFEAGAWLPGGEHVKKIVVKNVSRRTIKFKYELPTTKYFSMDFPTLLTLSPGMQTVLDLAFRPVKAEEYDDFVTFHVQIIAGGVTASSGSFRLPVVARIAQMALEVPTGLDFGFCPTAETTELKFHLRNTGQIDAIFNWSIPGAGEHGRPFAVHPATGHIGVGQEVELIASFCPMVASVYVTTTVCSLRSIGANDTTTERSLSPSFEATMKLSGISKFTHVAASETQLSFGEVLVGATNSTHAPTEKEFILRNRSLVRASFRIQRVENDCDAVFSFWPMNGIVPPESSVTIRVKYTPTSAGAYTCDHFDIVTPGGNSERLTCTGHGIGPTVSLWKKNPESNFVRTRSINFSDIVLGQSTSRVLTLRNESPIGVFFHFDTQEKGIFVFDKTNGRISPLSDVNVTVSFSPTRVGNFYRRFFLLLQNQSTLYVDVLGTSYDDKIRPSPFQQTHVDAYRLRAASGLGLLSPDQLDAYWQENGDELFRGGALRRVVNGEGSHDEIASDARSLLLTRSGEAKLADVDTCQEYFISIEERDNPITVQGAFLDFGNCGIVQFPSKKILQVTNNTHGKVTCDWRVASAAGRNAFQVFPESLDINAGTTAEFRVAFQPKTENTYYFAELEGYVSFKSNRTFRLVNVETFTPPWCVISKVYGNTFASPIEQFLPKVAIRLPRQHRLEFPPCYLGDCVFQTILLQNSEDTPAFFSFVDDPSLIFQCKPSSGYIAAMSFHLVQIRFAPRQARNYHYTLHCIINNARSMPESLELAGISALPALAFKEDASSNNPGTDAKVFIKPTAIGLLSERTIVIANISRVPLVFRWDIPQQLQGVFGLSPKLGRLNGRESTRITCRFIPQEIRAYVSRFVVAVKPISVAWGQLSRQSGKHKPTEVPVLQELSLRVQTKGTAGAISFKPEAMTFETILINSSSKKSLFIVNTADCDLHFSLTQSFRVVGGENMPAGQGDSAAGTVAAARLVFSVSHGCIPARSRKEIVVAFLPKVAGSFEFSVSCHTSVQSVAQTGEGASHRGLGQHTRCCLIRAEASFPTVVIEDIRVPNLPSTLAWPHFLCREINKFMSTPPSSAKLTEKDIDRHPESDDHDLAEEEVDVKHVAVAFSPSPLGAVAEQIYLKLRNPGNLVVEFSLKYPKEGNVEIEHWAETGAPSSDEIRTNAIIDSKVFQISPRRATLLPRETITLALSYSFTSDLYGGTHDLPVLLHVKKGKRLVLELQGRTLARNEPKLYVSRRMIALSPVVIGEYRRPVPHQNPAEDESPMVYPPLQRILVSNRGDAAFRLDVSCNSFGKINQHDFGAGGRPMFYPVLRCVTTSEIVAANSSVYVELEFAPIEAKTVEANLILKAYGLMGRAYKEVAMVTVLATGFHPLRTSLAVLRRELALAVGGSPPDRQSIVVPGQSVQFQHDSVSFGHVPTFAQRTLLLVLVNTSPPSTDAVGVHFMWDGSHPLVSSGVVSFSPAKGDLQPGQEALVRATVSTTEQVLVIDHNFACCITPSEPAVGILHSSDSVHVSSVVKPKKRGVTTSLKTRPSVITRSTASQVAAAERGHGEAGRKGEAIGSVDTARSLSTNSYCIFAHVYAHILPRPLYERFYPRDDLIKLPLPTVTEQTDSAVPSFSTFLSLERSTPTITDCQEVVEDVMDALFTEVLSSDAVLQAVDDCGQVKACSSTPFALCGEPRVFRRARVSEDCAAIASTVLENTVFNVLQELFHGDFEQELACVPRKAVFPKGSSPQKTSIANSSN